MSCVWFPWQIPTKNRKSPGESSDKSLPLKTNRKNQTSPFQQLAGGLHVEPKTVSHPPAGEFCRILSRGATPRLHHGVVDGDGGRVPRRRLFALRCPADFHVEIRRRRASGFLVGGLYRGANPQSKWKAVESTGHLESKSASS